MTLLEIVNRIMIRLREAEVSSSTASDYATLAATFVSDVHQDVVTQYDWTCLRHTLDVDMVVGQKDYDLARFVADGGAVVAGGRTTNQGSMFLGQAWCFDDSTDDGGSEMILVSEQDLEELYQGDRDATQEDVVYFSLRQSPAQEGLQLSVWPLPETTNRLRIRFWTPEAVLETDGTDDATTILIPWRPVYLGALARLINERGEELGEPGNLADSAAYNALSQAIEADMNTRQFVNEYEFVVN